LSQAKTGQRARANFKLRDRTLSGRLRIQSKE
jgi:hypothetical protein